MEGNGLGLWHKCRRSGRAKKPRKSVAAPLLPSPGKVMQVAKKHWVVCLVRSRGGGDRAEMGGVRGRRRQKAKKEGTASCEVVGLSLELFCRAEEGGGRGAFFDHCAT